MSTKKGRDNERRASDAAVRQIAPASEKLTLTIKEKVKAKERSVSRFARLRAPRHSRSN